MDFLTLFHGSGNLVKIFNFYWVCTCVAISIVQFYFYFFIATFELFKRFFASRFLFLAQNDSFIVRQFLLNLNLLNILISGQLLLFLYFYLGYFIL